MLHGAGSASQWRPFHERLSERFDLIAPDHPGFGLSDQPAWLDNVQDLVYHYLELLEALDLERVHLLGTSLGGWIAATLAVGHSERIRGMVLVAPAGLKKAGVAMPDLFAMNAEQRAYATLYDERLAAERAAQTPSREELERQLRDQATLARLAWSPYLHDPKLPHWLHRVSVPTLLIWGRHDRIIPFETSELWLRHLPDARLEVIEEAGHTPHVERAEEVVKLITDFLESPLPQPSPPRGRGSTKSSPAGRSASHRA